jgi:hypothetical protein
LAAILLPVSGWKENLLRRKTETRDEPRNARELLEIMSSFRGLTGRKTRVEAWNAGLRFLPWGSGVGIAPSLLRVIGIPFIHPLFGLASATAAFLAGVLVAFLGRGSVGRRTLEIDKDLALKQALPTVFELARAEEGTETPSSSFSAGRRHGA